MLMNLYVFITLITAIVKINECQNFGTDKSLSRPVRKSIFPVAKTNLKRSNSNGDVNDAKFFETISESASSTTTMKPYFERKRKNNAEVNFGEIKGLLSKMLDKIQEMERDANSKREINSIPGVYSSSLAIEVTTVGVKKRAKNIKKHKRKEKDEKKSRWGKWTDWSPCSVSCGKGREIRWRHCVENCEIAETEMEEKTCQLPACGPSRLFGVIKL